jgi:hypothetical protein
MKKVFLYLFNRNIIFRNLWKKYFYFYLIEILFLEIYVKVKFISNRYLGIKINKRFIKYLFISILNIKLNIKIKIKEII